MRKFKINWSFFSFAYLFTLIISPIIFNTFTPFGQCRVISLFAQTVICNMQSFFSVVIAPFYLLTHIPNPVEGLWIMGLIWCTVYMAIFLIVFLGIYLIRFLLKAAFSTK